MIKSGVISLLCILPSIVAFLLVIQMSGNYDIAQAIWDSWHIIYNQPLSEVGHWNGTSISAIGWPSKWAVVLHVKSNFLSNYFNVASILVWMITFPVVYYISTNTLLAFRKNENDFKNQHKTALSSILIFQLVCLSPVFMVLSNDYSRIISYWIMSSFAFFLLIPIDKIASLFPVVLVNFVERINEMMTNMLQPSKTTLAFLMMFIGISGCGFTIEAGYVKSTMVYNILFVLSKPFIILGNYLSSLF